MQREITGFTEAVDPYWFYLLTKKQNIKVLPKPADDADWNLRLVRILLGLHTKENIFHVCH